MVNIPATRILVRVSTVKVSALETHLHVSLEPEDKHPANANARLI